MTGSEVRDALRYRYRPPAWAFFEEVQDATGGGSSRSADALAFSLWPSQGLEMHGFEIKTSRNDWRRELARPEKADKVLGYCDRIFAVATEKGIVHLEELPPTWGLMEPAGHGLRAARPAEKNPAARPLDRHFFASLMRHAYRYIKREIDDADRTKEAYQRGRDEAESAAKGHLQRADERVHELEKAIFDFEQASGVQISTWDAGNIGQAVKVLANGGGRDLHGRIRRLKEDIDRMVIALDGAAV